MRINVAALSMVAVMTSAGILSACTSIYTREFAVDEAQAMPLSEQQQVFVAFREFLASKGFKPSYDPGTDPDRARYVIGQRPAEASRPSPLAYRDVLEIAYGADTGFRLRLTRITDQMSDFSQPYLANFVTQTENFLREATGKPVRIALVPDSGRR